MDRIREPFPITGMTLSVLGEKWKGEYIFTPQNTCRPTFFEVPVGEKAGGNKKERSDVFTS